MANSVNPDQTAPIGAAPIGAVCSGSTLFASILNSSVILGNYLQQTTFSDTFFLAALMVKKWPGDGVQQNFTDQGRRMVSRIIPPIPT